MDLNSIVKKLQSEYAGIELASSIEDSDEYISTGNKGLDLCLGGGIAWGYVTEVSGFSGSGKTLLLQLMLADAQKKYNAQCIWFDRENAWFNERAEELGINIDDVILIRPQAIATVDDMNKIASEVFKQIDDDRYLFIALDSLSSFEAEVKWNKKEQRYSVDMGKKAQSFHQFFRKVIPKIGPKCSFIFTNQLTYKVGVLFGDNTTQTGGESPKYYTTYRLKLDDRRVIVDATKGNEVVGNWIQAVVIKTRRGPNYRNMLFPFYFKEGIPYYGGYARLLVDRGYLKPKNKSEFTSCKQSTITYNDKQYNEHKIESLLKESPELDFTAYPEYYKEKKDVEPDGV